MIFIGESPQGLNVGCSSLTFVCRKLGNIVKSIYLKKIVNDKGSNHTGGFRMKHGDHFAIQLAWGSKTHNLSSI